MSTDHDPVDDLARIFRGSLDRAAAADAFYSMLKSRGLLPSHRVLTYRCPRRCLLVDVLQTRQGIVVHQGRYKQSRSLNEATSSPAGRAANTEDGDRRWKGRTFFIEQAINLTLSCDHIAHRILDVDDLRAALTNDTPEIVIT